MTKKVFIDGEAGTTGLQIADRLIARADVQLVSLAEERRKTPEARRDAMACADAAVLCLPDEAAREAASLAEGLDLVLIDASTAHRVAAGWVYGFPELRPGQRDAIAGAKRISNPGCYPTGFLALVRPLVDAGLFRTDAPLSVHAISGYSGGGKAMISTFESGAGAPYRAYALGQAHKHLPEMRVHAGLQRDPVFTPAVGSYAQGMIVEIPLALWSLPGAPKRRDLHSALDAAYAGERFVHVSALAECDALDGLEPEGLNGTNRLEIFVFGNDEQVRLAARLDNLGKGASGAAVQNLNLALGFDEAAGL